MPIPVCDSLVRVWPRAWDLCHGDARPGSLPSILSPRHHMLTRHGPSAALLLRQGIAQMRI